MIGFSVVPLHQVVTEILEAAPRHFREIVKDGGAFDPDIDSYVNASRAGNVIVVTARDNGVLIGYSVFSIAPAMRQKTNIEAQNHALYVEKKYRSEVGLKLIDLAEAALKKLGVKTISYTNDSPLFGRLMKRKGYAPKYTIWEKSNGL